jgi:hypothetical protein
MLEFPRYPDPPPMGPVQWVIFRMLMEQRARLWGPIPDDVFDVTEWGGSDE